MEGRKAGVLIGLENRDVLRDVGDRSLYPPPSRSRIKDYYIWLPTRGLGFESLLLHQMCSQLIVKIPRVNIT